MKLFVALVPPSEAVEELAAVVRPLHSLPQAAPLRWTGLPSWHLTLAFLGQVDAEQLPPLEAGLAAVAAAQPAFALRLGGAGHFGDRALWAGVHGDTAAIGRLAGASADAARQAGLGVDDGHGFTAHLTLARSSTPRSAGRHAGRPGGPDLRLLAAALTGFRGLPWPADTLRLMRSHQGAGPSPYETVAAWPLAQS
ncbi:RNA 2',3'-cyclic phosphodiesterase [Streptacidiphilus sp. PB12-B1b]|uniref:RNA 2',3'-cyclic phosphodiesterase n=1 Tax=Streptacidiphilus sp. PB12-B1b TaxID=2705012 RepID=UPI0015FE30B3|nr:RNA 2',3'-cyclic phosphodiesterase [Streptacidiphilus sp. PB12-B1b]QMU79480.1 RNA 2',3'-cyclic phosphodiesterase [Streptacidiphilus sp. PB12-B1b]